MTKEQKELLLKDLCGRLPYGVKYVRSSWNYDTDQELSVIETLECVDKDGYINHRRVHTVDDIKVCLLPLSSMTEEQKKEFDQLLELELKAINDEINHTQSTAFEVDFYHKHHLDWRELIPMGLAIDATSKNIY